MADTANSTTLSIVAILPATNTNTEQSVADLYKQWCFAMSCLSECEEELAAHWYVKLSELENAVMVKPATTVQEYAMKILIHTNNGDFTPTDAFIAEAQAIAGTN